MKTTDLSFRLRVIALLCFVPLLLVNCSKDEEPMATQSVADIVSTNPDFTLLRAALQRAGLTEAVQTGTFTVFAPTNAAFSAAGYADAAAINAIPDTTLRSLLQYHVVGSKIETAFIPYGANSATNNSLLTRSGALYLSKSSAGVSVNGAMIVQADLLATNGVVHAIERVLMPPRGNLVQVLASQPQNFSLLTAAAIRADTALLTALTSATSVITVFAPTNAAFEAAGFNAAAIQKATSAQLAAILRYHALPGRVFTTNLASGKITTLQSGTATVAVGATNITVTGTGNGSSASTITRPNILATNGVIHVIDRVLLPMP